MSKAKKKKIKARKYEARQAQASTERIVSAIAERPVKLKSNWGNRIKM